jgi:hypothetical protein
VERWGSPKEHKGGREKRWSLGRAVPGEPPERLAWAMAGEGEGARGEGEGAGGKWGGHKRAERGEKCWREGSLDLREGGW